MRETLTASGAQSVTSPSKIEGFRESEADLSALVLFIKIDIFLSRCYNDGKQKVQKLEKLLCALPERYYNIGLSRIYELAEKYPKPYRHLMRSVNNGWEQAEKYLEKGMEEGMIREVSIPVVMAMVKGTVYCFMESDILYQNELTYEQAKKEMVEILMKGIKTGGKSKDSGN